MVANKETTKKKCCFYASDFHLEMTILPYINKKIEENKEIAIVTENGLEETVKILISRMNNIKNKSKILNINWNNNDVKHISSKEKLVIIINGNKKFVENKNKEIEESLESVPVEIINCYSFEEAKDEMVEIAKEYIEVINNLQKNS